MAREQAEKDRQARIKAQQARAQAEADDEGRFELVVAGRDPGRPNWLDTEGRRRGVVFCRFQLVEGEIEPLETEVVAIDSLAG